MYPSLSSCFFSAHPLLLHPPSTNFTAFVLFSSFFSSRLWVSAPTQAGAPTPPDLSTRQQSPPPPPASPLSRSNLCSLLYSAPSGMAVVSGKSFASSWMQPPTPTPPYPPPPLHTDPLFSKTIFFVLSPHKHCRHPSKFTYTSSIPSFA